MITQEQYNALKSERDALAAQVDDLEFQRVCAVAQSTNMFDALRLAISAFDRYEMSVDDHPSIEHVKMRGKLYSATFENSEKCLAEIRAEAGRAGYYRGFKDGLVIDCPKPSGTQSNSSIDYQQVAIEQAARVNSYKYADTVRQGGE